MVNGNNPTMVEIQCLRNAAWVAISTATVGGTERNMYWKASMTHCCRHYFSSGGSQAMENSTDRLLTFAVAVREG
jgi:hypothetical protein